MARGIIYRPRNVRAHRVYGYSPVQQVLMTVNIGLRRQLWQLDLRLTWGGKTYPVSDQMELSKASVWMIW